MFQTARLQITDSGKTSDGRHRWPCIPLCQLEIQVGLSGKALHWFESYVNVSDYFVSICNNVWVDENEMQSTPSLHSGASAI